MVDVSKIRTGDTVTVKAIARHDYQTNGAIRLKLFTSGDCFTASAADISTHTPAPRKFKIGDAVTLDATVGGKVTPGAIQYVYEILKIDTDFAVLFRRGEHTGRPIVQLAALCGLRHVDT